MLAAADSQHQVWFLVKTWATGAKNQEKWNTMAYAKRAVEVLLKGLGPEREVLSIVAPLTRLP